MKWPYYYVKIKNKKYSACVDEQKPQSCRHIFYLASDKHICFCCNKTSLLRISNTRLTWFYNVNDMFREIEEKNIEFFYVS